MLQWKWALPTAWDCSWLRHTACFPVPLGSKTKDLEVAQSTDFFGTSAFALLLSSLLWVRMLFNSSVDTLVIWERRNTCLKMAILPNKADDTKVRARVSKSEETWCSTNCEQRHLQKVPTQAWYRPNPEGTYPSWCSDLSSLSIVLSADAWAPGTTLWPWAPHDELKLPHTQQQPSYPQPRMANLITAAYQACFSPLLLFLP